MSYLSIRHVQKKIKDHEILSEINLDITQGNFITLLGPSGCGKSTLLRCIAGLESINQGEIYLDGLKINDIKPAKRNIGMIFQQYSLFPTKTVFQNIAFGLKIRRTSKSIVHKRVDELLDIIGLSQAKDKYPSQLSGGEQQRVALARSLIIEPKVVLFDEPLSAIDAKLRKELQNKIKQIHNELNMTSIFVTHDQEEAMLLADVIYLMNNGKIEQIGTPRTLYSQPKNLFVAEFIGNHNIISQYDSERILGHTINKNYLVVSPEHIFLNSKFITNCVTHTAIVEDILFLGDFERIILDCQGLKLKCHINSDPQMIIQKKQSIQFSINLEACLYLDE